MYMVHKHLKEEKKVVQNPRNSPVGNACKKNSTNLVEHLGEVFRAVLECDAPILRMTFEKKLRLTFEGIGHALVTCRRRCPAVKTVHDADEAQFECPVSMSKRIHASIHQLQLGEDANRLSGLWVDGLCRLEGVKVGKVGMCG